MKELHFLVDLENVLSASFLYLDARLDVLPAENLVRLEILDSVGEKAHLPERRIDESASASHYSLLPFDVAFKLFSQDCAHLSNKALVRKIDFQKILFAVFRSQVQNERVASF